MTDSFKYQGLRKKLVDTIRSKGIADEDILAAIGHIQRHRFVEGFLAARAYDDCALPIASGQTISQPYTVAFQTQLLQLSAGQKVLEVGTGSGYQAAVLMQLGAKLYTIERHQALYRKTAALLNSLGYKPLCFLGDGYAGKPTYGPFDRILITAAAPKIPLALLQQLKVGGILVSPVGSGKKQIMTVVHRKTENDFAETTHGNFVFVPMLPGVEK